MPTRDEMNSCGVPFLALRRPEAIEVDASAAGLKSELGIRDAALVWATGRIAELEAALLRADQANTQILEVNATLMSEAREQHGIAIRLARENERLRQQVAMMADVQGPAACLGSAVDAWQAAIDREVASGGGMAASMERVEVLGVEWDDASEKATEAREPAPSPLPEKIDFASHGATSQASGHISRCGCAGLGCDREH